MYNHSTSFRGIGSASRMFYWCKQHSSNPSACIEQFIVINNTNNNTSSYNFIDVMNNTLKQYLTTFLAKGSASLIKCTSSYGYTPYTLTDTGEITIYDGYCIITPTKISDTELTIYLNNIVTYQPKAWGDDWIAQNDITTIATNDNNPNQPKIVYSSVTFTYDSDTKNNWLNGKTTGWPSADEVVSTNMSTIGILLNGAALYNMLGASDSTINTSTVVSGAQFTIHANAIQVEVFASCCGHSSGISSNIPYHYHQIPRCLKSLNSLSSLSYPNEDSTPTEINAYYRDLLASKTHPNCVGFMNDGCPIYIAVGYEYKYKSNGEYDGVKTDSNGKYITCFKRSPLILGDIDLNGFYPFILNGDLKRWWAAYKYYLDTTKKLDGKYTDVCHGCYGLTPDNGSCYHYYLMLDIDTNTNTFKTKFDTIYPYDFYNIIYDNDGSDIIDRLSIVMTNYGVPYNGSTTDHTTSTFILMLDYFYQTKNWSDIGLTINGYNVNQATGPNSDGYYTGVETTYNSYTNFIASLPSNGIINVWYNDLASDVGFSNFFSSSEQELFQIAAQAVVSTNLFTRGKNAMEVTMNTTTNDIKTWVTNVNLSLQTNLGPYANYVSLTPSS